jgi:cell division protein FtsI (penicillin-binding protein 3)
MSGVVFHNIAEGIMAQDIRLDVRDARDSTSVLIPDVKEGNILSADFVLTSLGIKTKTNFATNGKTIGQCGDWLNVRPTPCRYTSATTWPTATCPTCMAWGPRRGVPHRKRGVKCRLAGRGKVVKQSLEPGHLIRKGDVCTLTLE